MIKYIIHTSCFWMLVFSFGLLYALFNGVEIRLPAGSVQSSQIDSIFDPALVADNSPLPFKKHHKGE